MKVTIEVARPRTADQTFDISQAQSIQQTNLAQLESLQKQQFQQVLNYITSQTNQLIIEG